MIRRGALLPPGVHAPVEGIGDFYGGLLHPVAVAEHLIALVALGLLLGQQGPEAARQGLVAFGFALLGGMLLVEPGSAWTGLSIPLLAVALTLGLLCAAAVALPTMLSPGLAAATVLLVGMDSAVNQ